MINSIIRVIFSIFNYIFLYSYWLLIILIISRVLIKRRTISVSMAWLLTIYALPLIGIITYLLFGESNVEFKKSHKIKKIWSIFFKNRKKLKNYKFLPSSKNSDIADLLFRLCKHRQGIEAMSGNQVQLLKKTNDIVMSLITDIELAQHNINMVFYIWEPGGLVNHITKKLIMAAQRGVKCRLILDAIGCSNFFRSTHPNSMREAGIIIVSALNIHLSRIFLQRIDLRQHRKMILIDNNIAYTGSMNMVDPILFKKKNKVGRWIDIMVRIHGPIAITMVIIFSSDWETETGENILPLLLNNNYYKKNKLQIGHTIQIIPSGPGCSEGIIHQVLLTSVYSAKKTLIITTPYFIPSDDLLYALCTAAQRGVKVHIILPKHNDSILVQWASRAFFSELLESGVFIHQFYSGLLHAKSILIDQQLSFIGTVNLDIRSLWLNLEIMLIIDSKKFSNDLSTIQHDYILHSNVINLKKWKKRPYWERIIERLFYFLSPFL